LSGIDSVQRNGAQTGFEDVRATGGSIPAPRSAADAYRVSDDDVHRARLVVAENSEGGEDLRQLLDMLGLISSNPDQPPPVSR
jgi:molybdopterin biosynthesis enzyme